VAGKVCLDLVNAPSSVPAYFPLRCGGKSTTTTPKVFPGAQTRDGAPPNDERGAQPLEHAHHDGGVPLQLPPHDRGHVALKGANTGRSLNGELAVRLSNRSTQIIEPPRQGLPFGKLYLRSGTYARSPVPLGVSNRPRRRRAVCFSDVPADVVPAIGPGPGTPAVSRGRCRPGLLSLTTS
jgi:hypothetical protein